MSLRNVDFFKDYAPMRDSLLHVAREFVRGCKDNGQPGASPMDCRHLAIETRAKLASLHEMLLESSNVSGDIAVFHVRFLEALDSIFERHGHQPTEESS